MGGRRPTLDLEMTELLLKNNANGNIRNNHNQTPLTWSFITQDFKLADLLMKYDVYLQNSDPNSDSDSNYY